MYSSQVLMIKTYEELVTSYNKARATIHQIEKDNCKFVATSVEYLGHKIDTKRKHTLEHKVEAIQNLLTPKNTQQLKSFLGLVHYYGKFVSYLLLLIHPFNWLLKANAKWSWSDLSKQAFQQTNIIHFYFSPLWPLLTPQTIRGCFTIWYWGSNLANWPQWRRTISCLGI